MSITNTIDPCAIERITQRLGDHLRCAARGCDGCAVCAPDMLGGIVSPSWQPINTAPRDGTWILLWRGKAERGEWEPMIIGRAWDYDGDGTGLTWAWPDDVYDPFTPEGRKRAEEIIAEGYCDESFTHWMPLPAPPVDEEDENGQ